MADARFFETSGPFTLAELSEIAGAELADGAAADKQVIGVAPLSVAGADEISFLDNKKYVDQFSNSGAGACICDPALADRAPAGMMLLLSKRPYHGYARIADALHRPIQPTFEAGVFIHPDATIAADAVIGPGAVISSGASIGSGTSIGANAVIGPGVMVGEGSRVCDQVSLQCCLIGNRVIIHPGVRIGQDGFGFAMGPEGHLKVPQLGRVIVEDDVEIGANTSIDRGTGPDTVIGAGSKIDNLVQIGHNVKIGRCCVIVSHVGISGSTELGDFCVIGGQAGLAGHLKIGAGVQIAAQSGVMRDVEPGMKIGGSPAQPMKAWFRSVAAVEKLAKKSSSS